jgi:hypothetical protein
MEYSKNGAPTFDGQSGLEYEIWSRMTKVF